MKRIFSTSSSNAIRLGVLLAISIAVMTMDQRTHYLDPARYALSHVTYPIRYLVDLPSRALHSVGEAATSHATLLEKNQQLRARQFLLESQVQKMTALRVENMRLQRLLGSSFELSQRVSIAKLLAVDIDPANHQLLISKGKYAGVFEGQAVLDAKGVMGQVAHVGPLSSSIILITDPKHAIPVQVNRNGVRAIALGTGSSTKLELFRLPNNTDIKVGDLLETSGLGQRFPAGYPVATVTVVKIDPGQPFATITAAPLAELNRSREVLLVARSRGDALPADNGDMPDKGPEP